MDIELYAKSHLLTEIDAIIKSHRKNNLPQLSVYEKAVIYKYSDDGWETVNPSLRKSKGKLMPDFGTLLYNSLLKLPNFEGLVYRMVYLTPPELNRYKKALTGKNIKEYSFISTSKSRLIATNFAGELDYKPNCLFRIQAKTGKNIEKISRFDEEEIILIPNTIFNVLDVKKEANYTLITMEEI